MKEFDAQPHDKVESHHERNVKQEKIKLQASMMQRKGMTLWEYNTKSGILSKAVFEDIIVAISENPNGADPGVTRKKVITKDDCVYFQKLNINNAVRYLLKHGYSNIYQRA